jgi:mannose-1-phosphate guanylyltransferase
VKELLEKYAVIMAGGAGSRLWPVSREKTPKQFIVIEDNKCMLIQTLERLCDLVPPEKCFVITNKKLLDITKNTLDGIIPLSNIIAEPARKNTAACIAYASLLIKKIHGSGLICFVPADGYVKNKSDYQKAVDCAYQAAEDTNELVVIGIKPTYPATGYGYINIDRSISEEIYKVRCFAEKPDSEKAQLFFESNEYLWNSGIVVGNIDTIIAHVKEHLPKHYKQLSQAVDLSESPDFTARLEKAYREIPDISFDYGVLEKSKTLRAVEGGFDWNDIGNLDALAKTFLFDTEGNLIKGTHVGIDTTNSIIYSDDILVTTIDVDNMIVAAFDDAVLICRRDRVQDIKKLVTLLKNSGYEHLI